jgi:hypothetical protein
MFTKKFLDSNFTPLSIIVSRQKKLSENDDAAALVKQDAPPSTNNSANGTNAAADVASVLSRHKGKLAIGAAAMLGIAAFYHWRESKLAREDEEEYARLQRLKAALDADSTKAEHRAGTCNRD